ncbi:MAG: hypothetical protein HQL99_11005 [Magnetococcales bacterium]|nr:hypothetical protein [Magnetococcales bacterium]
MDKTQFPDIHAMVQSIVAGVAEHDNLVADQCALLVQAAERLVGRLALAPENDAEEPVGTCHKEERAATLIRNLDLLSRCPPLERHEWLRAVLALDALTGRIDDTLQEASLLCVDPDPDLQAMVLLIHASSDALAEGFTALRNRHAGVQPQVATLSGLVDSLETRYLRAMRQAMNPARWTNDLTPPMVFSMMKRWMVYRALFDIQKHLTAVRDALLALSILRAAHPQRLVHPSFG